ncbi:hypothetical protein AB4Z55_24280 [Gordonia sp. ABKF26]|uniref:hypothetical protein n=1 Tax=Gordonia sp. ABKF26 TaxID=3238687 RepID=UPI0034E552A6
MSTNAHKLYQGQTKTLEQRVEQYNEAAADLGKTFDQLSAMGEPSMKELCLALGSALVQSNVLIARMISVGHAEDGLMTIAAEAGYLTDNRHPGRQVDSDIDLGELTDETRLLIQEEGITVDPGALAGLTVSLDCGNGVAKHLSAKGSDDLGRALIAAAAASRHGERVDQ